MTTHPTPLELVDAVALFIEQTAAPQLTDRDAFLARVAVNALGVIRRELESGAALEAAATARMSALLGRTGDYATLNAALCAELRDGGLDAASPELIAHLRAETIDRLRIDQPRYAGLKSALDAEGEPA